MSKTTQAKKMTKIEEKAKPVEVQAPVAEHKAEKVEVKTKTNKVRGKKYLAAKKKIDVKKYYPISSAIKLAKETSLSKFVGKLEAHITTLHTPGNIGDIVFPHLEAVAKKIVIATDAVIADIKEGKLDFDILVANTATMPKLVPLARILGPKGLMPNPKNGTLTDKLEEAVKKLSVAKTVLKTEKSAPVVHLTLGKLDQPDKELEANLNELIKVLTPQKVKKLVICGSMGPAIKVEVLK